MILLISICENELHELEFVRPIEDILKSKKMKFRSVNYKSLKKKDLQDAKKVIICGTSFLDRDFLDNLGKFSWIKGFNKPLLGICGGMEVIGINYRCRIIKKIQIGLLKITLKGDFLGFKKRNILEGYNLHKLALYINRRDFETIAYNKCAQIIVHRTKPVYGLMFHPEVRNKEIIEKFVK